MLVKVHFFLYFVPEIINTPFVAPGDIGTKLEKITNYTNTKLDIFLDCLATYHDPKL